MTEADLIHNLRVKFNELSVREYSMVKEAAKELLEEIDQLKAVSDYQTDLGDKYAEENKHLKEQLEKNPCVVTPDWHCSDCLKENAELKEVIANLEREKLRVIALHSDKEEDFRKKIAELEKQVTDLEWQLQEVAKDNDYYQTENKRLKNEIIQKCYPEQMEIFKGVSN